VRSGCSLRRSRHLNVREAVALKNEGQPKRHFAIARERLWTMISPEIRSIGWRFRLSAKLCTRSKEFEEVFRLAAWTIIRVGESARKMGSIRIQIDSKEIKVSAGTTILLAAAEAGIDIPTLCYHRDFIPSGSCRICVVELEGSSRLIGACHTPAANGMILHTRTAKVLSARKATVELLLAGHTGPCVKDYRAARCDLHKIASDLEVEPPRFSVKRPRFYPIENLSPYVHRDLSKCILCSRCINACSEIAGQYIFSTGYRGFRSKIVVDNDVPLNKEVCRDCRLCVEYCPTGALSKPGQPDDKKRGKKMVSRMPHILPRDPRCGNLLPMLKKAQDRSHYLSGKFIGETADSLNLSISEVYGVSTFYSFLSTKPLGRNVIRVCKSVPCYLQGSQMILRSIEDEIGIKPGQATRDKKFSLELTNCIGACDRAPALLVNQDVYGNLTPKKISRILQKY
jgi:NADH:ubiquinone oxidoreductase subunit E/NAD-dependent dihydropyrimidine dehydrogenase PreA subunit